MDLLNQTRESEESNYGEAVRLSNEIRSKPSRIVINPIDGSSSTIPAKTGFDFETATYTQFTTWLGDNSIKKSDSLFWFVIRVMTVRFPDKHTGYSPRSMDTQVDT